MANNNNIAELKAKTEELKRSISSLNAVLDDLQRKQEYIQQ